MPGITAANDDPIMDTGNSRNAEADRQCEMARIKVRKKRYSEALDALEGVLKADPFHAEGLLLRARALEDMGQLTDARLSLEKVLSQYPQYSPAHREYGRFLLREGSPRSAETELLRALTINPQDAYAHALLAEVCVCTGRKQQGLLHLEIASRLRTEEIRYDEVCARVLTRLGDTSEKVRFLK